ncbi:MAG TPA: hypothetical protein ENI55_02295 [Alphaproteobacteria bacterium]|nr:hypothetical protein [Alphaproteobacteria bacterium]
MVAKRKINDLISIATRLAGLLETENKALREYRAADVKELLEEKINLCRTYESRVLALDELSRTPDKFEDVDGDMIERLQVTSEKLQFLIEINSRLLKVSIEANKRVLDAVAEAIKESSAAAGIYTAHGAVDPGNTTAASQTTPISVNRSL